MRIIIILLFCAFFSFQATAQKKLKYDISKTSGDTSFHTSEDRLYVKAGSKGSIAEQIKSSIYKRGTTFSICFSIESGRTSVMSIEEDDAASITLQDGNIITLHSTGYQKSGVTHRAYGCYIFGFYRLNAAAIRSLKASPVSSIRVHTSAGNLDYDIKGKFSGIIVNQLAKFD